MKPLCDVESDMSRPWFKVRVKSSYCSDTWYADKIGEVIVVRKTEWDGWGFEHKSGYSVFRHDVVPIAKGRTK